MLLELDQSTLAYMTAALEDVCKRIPPEQDSDQLRRQIADAMVASAKAYRRTFSDFEEAGMKVLDAALPPRGLGWFRGWKFR